VWGHNVNHARPQLTHQEMQNCVCLNIPYSRDNCVLCASRSYAVPSVFNDDWFTVSSLRSRLRISVVYLNSHRFVNSRPAIVFVIDPQLISYKLLHRFALSIWNGNGRHFVFCVFIFSCLSSRH